jgi:hypothetical protein
MAVSIRNTHPLTNLVTFRTVTHPHPMDADPHQTPFAADQPCGVVAHRCPGGASQDGAAPPQAHPRIPAPPLPRPWRCGCAAHIARADEAIREGYS